MPADPQNLLSNLHFEPGAFDSFTSSTRLRYTLREAATTTAVIIRRTPEGGVQPVATLFQTLHESTGSHSHTWIGNTDAGTFAAAGTYIAVLEAGGESYETEVRVYHP
jgi:hypothetical protein